MSFVLSYRGLEGWELGKLDSSVSLQLPTRKPQVWARFSFLEKDFGGSLLIRFFKHQ
jgi:hypothetical protein